jgi:anti-anti-sigma factor
LTSILIANDLISIENVGGRVLRLDVQESPLVTILRCSGRIVYGNGINALLKAVMSKDTRYFLIDLHGVNAIDAAGLGAFATLERWARRENRTIHLANVSRRVREALETTGLSSVLQYFPDLPSQVLSGGYDSQLATGNIIALSRTVLADAEQAPDRTPGAAG